MKRYAPSGRAANKEAARSKDARDLAEGRASREDLRRSNGLFSGLEITRSEIVCEDDFS